MNHNLKNRPWYDKRRSHPIAVDTSVSRYEEWFEGFEKELREIVKDVEKMKHHKEYNTIYLLKEILGETPID